MTASAVLLAGAGTGTAAPADEPVPADGAEIVPYMPIGRQNS
ncbi:hypothetical protein ABZ154_14695 [Streptomyces sp. NPDC006261]